jgi:hypothetical protein
VKKLIHTSPPIEVSEESIMKFSIRMKLSLLMAVCLILAPFFFRPAGAADEAAKTQQIDGKVVPLVGLLEKSGSKLDREAAPHWLALVTDDGKVYPLIPEDGSRLFFKDSRLLNRPMRVNGRLFQDTHLLQVLSVNSIVKGQLHELYYWCDICSIRRNELLPRCDCCGGPLELREVPVKK